MFRLDTGRGALSWIWLILLGAVICDLLPYVAMGALVIVQIVLALYFVALLGYLVWTMTFGFYFELSRGDG